MHATAAESTLFAVAWLRPAARKQRPPGGVRKVAPGLYIALGVAFLVAVLAPAAEAAAPRVKKTAGAPLGRRAG